MSIYKGFGGGIARVIDNGIALVAPGLAMRRLEYRAQRGVALAYDAARITRTRRTRPLIESANDDLIPDLPRLRSNSRTMVRDDPMGSAVLSTILENTVGTGIRGAASVAAGKASGFDEPAAEAWNREATEYYEHWMRSDVDATGHTDGFGMQQQGMIELIRDGEFLCKRTTLPAGHGKRSTRTGIQFIDVDRLQDPRGNTDPDLAGGIKVGKFGEAETYYITPYHPMESGRYRRKDTENEPQPFQAFDGDLRSIIHGFRRDRAGQSRGIPMFASCFGVIEALNDIIESEGVASRAASKIAMVITSAPALGQLGSRPDLERQADGQWLEKAGAGKTVNLRAGEDMKPFVPQRPGNTWDAFVQRMMRLICGNFGLPYELVARDFAKMSFSGGRLALREAARRFVMLEQLFSRHYCQPTYEACIFEGVTSGAISRPPNWLKDSQAYMQATWTPPARGYVDPEKDVKASGLAIERNLSTPQEEAAKQGKDWRKVLQERAEHFVLARKIEQKNGLEPNTLTREAPDRIEAIEPAGETEGEDNPSQDSEPVEPGAEN